MSIQKQLNIIPVILAGGAGKRLRPLTSPTRPKPFIKFFARNSLFQDTLERAKFFAPPVIVCAAPFANKVFEECYELGAAPEAIICEPAQRGTAAAIAAAAFHLQGRQERLLVMPSDHHIEDPQSFAETIRAAAERSEDIVLIGAKPQEAGTRYGYITTDGQGHLHKFIEKPDRETALMLYAQKTTFWNTGIFLCRPQTFLSRLKQAEPLIYKRAEDSMTRKTAREPFIFPSIDHFIDIPSRSVDYAVMERLTEAGVQTLTAPWHDLGTWGSLLHIRLHGALDRIEQKMKMD